jgi:uncharacterized protein YjdB
MKKKNTFMILTALITGGFVLSGCLGFKAPGIAIETEGNVSSVLPGRTLLFSATGQDIVWTVSSTTGGTGPVANGTGISASGILTVAGNETSGVLYVTASSLSSGLSATKPIRVTTVTGINITPANQSIESGGTIRFYAAVTGSNNPDSEVMWRISSNAAGTGYVSPGTYINTDGLLTVSSNETLQVIYIFAVSVLDPSKSAVTAVTVLPRNNR